MEVAGLVLGAVPLILYALDNYQTAWDPAKSWYNWKDVIEELSGDISLQKWQLDATLANIGIKDPTMEQVESALMMQCPEKCEQFMKILRRMDALVKEVMEDLDLDERGQPKWGDSISTRASWEWDRVKVGFGKKRRKEIIAQLRSWNRDLQNCGLEKREIAADSENRIVDLVRKRFDDRRIAAIRANALAIYNALKPGFGCACGVSHRGNFELNWHSGKPYSTTTFTFALSHQATVAATTPATISWKTISLTIEDVAQLAQIQNSPAVPAIQAPAPSIPAAQQQSKRERVVRFLNIPSKKTHHKSSSAQSGSTSQGKTPRIVNEQLANTDTVSSAQNSAANTPTPSRSTSPVPLVGLCSISERLFSQGLPVHIPVPNSNPDKQLRIHHDQDSVAVSKRDVHLNLLLSKASDSIINRRLALSRKQRFGVSAALAWAVLHLCDSPWLGKTLKNDEIQLFLESQVGAGANYLSNNPYLSCNFSLPPPNPGPTSTSGQSAAPGSHTVASIPPSPPSQSEQFQSNQIKNMTLFTLAIRLIELGLNKPFKKIQEEYRRANAASNTLPSGSVPTIADDFKIAETQILELYLDPGKTYANAADRCLKFLFPGPEDKNTFEFGDFRSTFFADVVAPIQATFELIPGSCAQLPI